MQIPDIDIEKYARATKAQLELNRERNREKDDGKSLEKWGLIASRPFGNMQGAIEDCRLDEIEKYAIQVSAVLAEIIGKVNELRNP